MKIVITGVPQAGKTTLAELLSKMFKIRVLSTDDLRHLEWSAASEEISWWFDQPDDWIIEGVSIPRSLRKWQIRNPNKSPPFDWFLYMPNPRYAYESKGQETLGKQVHGLASIQKPWIGERWIDV